METLVPVPNQSATGTQVLLEYQWTFGTGTTLTGTGTNMRSLQNFDFGARAHSSFESHFEITNVVVFKPTLGQN